MSRRQGPASWASARNVEHAPARPVVAGVALAAAAVLLLGGCCGCGLPTQAPSSAGAGSAGEAANRPVTVRALDGRRIQIPSQRPTVVYFFSAGCAQCIGGARALVQARKQAGAAATFLAVDLDPTQSPAVIREFAALVGDPDLPAASDRDAALGRRYQVSALGTLAVIDPTGTVTDRAVDPDTAQILAAVAKAARA